MCRPGWAEARVTDLRLRDFTRLRRVRDRIDREYARPLDVLELARDADLPPALLTRQFRLAYGSAPYDYLLSRRAERARTLRLHGAGS
ncbi:hypothetical protein ACF07V_30610 [Streptomyces sp. NPDC015661]|uniref:hypothetical protein n=1 Tax=Streptomyces sp. NPDC015661 TaxID=3364961 RepID=UPI0036FD3AA9